MPHHTVVDLVGAWSTINDEASFWLNKLVGADRIFGSKDKM